MVNVEEVAYNIAAFVSTIFLLEFGADKLVDHTAILARRTGIPETIVGLLTVGGEWEELAIVIASLARGRGSLAIGNIVGSAISNILGAFSLGLLFSGKDTLVHFDTSARIYCLILLFLTTLVVPIVYFDSRIVWLAGGAVLITLFGVYICSVGWAIWRGTLIGPEDSDDDNSEYASEERTTSPSTSINDDRGEGSAARPHHVQPSRQSATNSISAQTPISHASHRRHTLIYHVFYLLFGLFAISLSGYVLSQAATNITDQFGISDVLFGVIILAIATTLPEKFVAVLSSRRGHNSILVANTVGSNTFLLLLCVGVIMVDTLGDFGGKGNVTIPELCVLWASTLAFAATIWYGSKFCRWIGAGMLLCYVAFIALEFSVIHSVVNEG